MSKYLDFIEFKTDTKTKVFKVNSKRSGNCLAIIKWYSPWRQYCFYPMPQTIFNNTCLLDIVEFIKIIKEMKNND
ncbi:MAG: hypothetical protein ACYDIA_01850 [Candidatus Humimicrobiaceae bacterium]